MIQIQSGLWSCEMEVVCAAWGALPIAAISAETSFAVGQEVNCWEMKLRYDALLQLSSEITGKPWSRRES